MLRELAHYYRPTTVHEALWLLQQPHTVVLAGGTELLGRHDTRIKTVVDLQGLQLDYIRSDADGLRIGAMTRLESLVGSAPVRELAGGIVSQSAWSAAQRTEREAATVGGTVAGAPAWHDLLTALLVTDAWVVVLSPGSTSVTPLDALLRDRTAHLGKGALISEVMIPHQLEGSHYASQRVSRTPRDRTIVGVAVRVAWSEGRLCDVRVAVGGAGDHAQRLTTVESLLDGRALNESEMLQASVEAKRVVYPLADALASAEYRREMVAVLLKRALEEVKLQSAE